MDEEGVEDDVVVVALVAIELLVVYGGVVLVVGFPPFEYAENAAAATIITKSKPIIITLSRFIRK